MREPLNVLKKRCNTALAIIAISTRMSLPLPLWAQQSPPNLCAGNEKLHQFDFWIG